MTDRKIMEQALADLKIAEVYGNCNYGATELLRNRLAQPEQKPVEYWTVADGWVSEQAEVPAAVWVEPEFWEHCNRVNCGTAYRLPAPGRQPLYTAPPQRKPLTDEQRKDLMNKAWDKWLSGKDDNHLFAWHFSFEVEAAHDIKENSHDSM